MQDSIDLQETELRASKALPIFGPGELPPEKMAKVSDDESGFIDVLKLFLRSWPYIRPQLLGRWFTPGEGLAEEVADNVAGAGYRFGYAPFLVMIVAIIGPLTGWVEPSLGWPMILLYIPVAALCIAMFVMTYSSGRTQTMGALLAVLAGFFVNFNAMVLIEGWWDGFYGVAVTVAAALGWMVQYRISNGTIKFRFRAGTHLCFYYLIVFTQATIGFFFGLILADLFNQALLQGEPLAPGLSKILGLPELSSELLESLSLQERMGLLWVWLRLDIILFLANTPLGYANSYYNMWILQRINQDLRVALVERWHQLSISYHSDHRTGDSIFRIYQDSAMVTNVIGQLVGASQMVINYFVAVAVVSFLSPWIGLFAALLVVPALTWAHIAMPRVRVRSLVYRASTSDVTSNVQETFSAIKLIKAFGTSDRVQKKFERDSVVAFNAAYRVRNLIALITIVMFTVAACFMILGESMMAMWAFNSSETWALDLIQLVGVSFVVWNLASFDWTKGQFRGGANHLRGLLRNWMTAQDMAMGLRRVFDILDIEPDIKDKHDAVPLTEFKSDIEFSNVGFRYEQDRPVLSDISFRAERGTVTAIIGPTGSGKSTLMALLLRLFNPDTGSISVDGKDIRDYLTHTLRGKIAIALQENLLFGMSVRDNIRYVAPNATDDQVLESLRIAAIDEYVKDLPNGLDTVLSDRGGKLSTGQRQRLSIARAIIRNAPLLVLDEPTAALDAATEYKVMQNLIEWVKRDKDKEGRAIFLITHRISTIRQADNILYLEDGKIIESGNHDDLMQLPGGRYRTFVETESNLTNVAGRSA
ncbi:MAG: ABC transporter ATP-binding protein [Gammaproteobacteria bacterium]|nr:ABC transporter ATP-binding protein [Gammaproteobacteria bacterium]